MLCCAPSENESGVALRVAIMYVLRFLGGLVVGRTTGNDQCEAVGGGGATRVPDSVSLFSGVNGYRGKGMTLDIGGASAGSDCSKFTRREEIGISKTGCL